MPPKKSLLSRLDKLPGAIVGEWDPFSEILRSPSPSVNFIFGNTHGLPASYTAILYGPPKAGKSVLCNMIVGQLHRDDPDAVVLKYDTELRERGQMTPRMAKVYGIDLERYKCFSTNRPEEIFDPIETDIAALVEEGVKVRLIIIDSVSNILGRRSMNADSVMQQQIGDKAMTIQDGLSRILTVLRRNKISLILTAQARAELDQLEQRRGNKFKMAGAYYLQHFGEFFIVVEANKNKEGRQDMLGNNLENEELTDLRENAEQTGHKIRVTMKESSVGSRGRSGEFTFDYRNGLINVHEEVFRLGVNRKIVDRPNGTTYEYGGKKWVGKPAFLEALKNDEHLREAIIKELIQRDIDGNLGSAVASEDASDKPTEYEEVED